MKENKQKICNLLCDTLRETIMFEDLLRLDYRKHRNGEETVEAVFIGGYKKTANVTADSGFAMVYDVFKTLT